MKQWSHLASLRGQSGFASARIFQFEAHLGVLRPIGCGLTPQVEPQRQATRPGLAVRGRFSPARAWWPAVAARLALCLGAVTPQYASPLDQSPTAPKMKTDEPTHDVEPAWIDAAWRMLVWLNRLALAVCIVAVPAWGFVTALSYPLVPSTYEVVAITVGSLLPFGYFLALSKEGATPRSLAFATIANCVWLLVSASPIAKLRVSGVLDAGDWILVGLAPLAFSNVLVFTVVYWAHRSRL